MPATQTKNVPELRFPGFEGNWEEKKLGDFLNIKSTSRVHKDEWTHFGVPFFRSSDVVANFKGEKNQKAFISLDLFERLSARSGKIGKGDILITGGGSIGTPYLVKSNNPLYFKDADLLWVKSEGTANSSFLFAFFTSPKFRKYLKKITHIGTIAHYTIEQAKATPISIPTSLEQEKIADFLGAVEERIAQLTRRRDLLETHKKGCMQRIFSGEMRFRDDEGREFPAREERRLGDVLDYEQPTRYLVSSTEYSEDFNVPVLTAGKTFLLGYTDETDEIFSSPLPVIIFDDFTTAFQFVDFPFKAKSSAMKILKLKSQEDNIRLIFEAMKLLKFKTQGHKRYWIAEYQDIKMRLPHPDEQRKIADFLSALDEKISLVSAELDQASEFKRGLLQKMFV